MLLFIISFSDFGKVDYMKRLRSSAPLFSIQNFTKVFFREGGLSKIYFNFINLFENQFIIFATAMSRYPIKY